MDEETTMRIMLSRAIAVAAAAAIALTAVALPANAGGGYYHRDNDAAAAAAVIGIFGTMAAIIAANQHRGHHHGYRYVYPSHGYYHRGYEGAPGLRHHHR